MIDIQPDSFKLSKQQIQDIATTICSDMLQYLVEKDDADKEHQKIKNKEN